MGEYPVTFVVFDILECNGQDMRKLPLKARRKGLEVLGIERFGNFKLVKQSTDVLGLWKEVTDLGGEGIIIKEVDSPYLEGKRSSTWRKVKDIKEVDLTFTKYERHNRGITVTSDKGIRVTVNGYQSQEVAEQIDIKGRCTGTIRHLGQTATGKYRQPTWMKLEAK